MNVGFDIKKEVWDARVKIVIGRFIMTAISVLFGIAIFGLFLDHFVFGDSGDAFFKPYMINFAFPISIVTLIVGYFTNYKKKKVKIDSFESMLTTYSAEINRQQIPSNVILVNCLSTDSSLGIQSNIKYYVYQLEQDLCFFPYRPQIELMDDYIAHNVSFSVVKIPIKEIIGYEPSERFNRTIKSYDSKKKLITVQETLETIKVTFQSKNETKVLFDKNIAATLEALKITPILIPKTGSAQKAKLDSVDNEDIPAKILKLKKMLADGLINEDEFQSQKKRLLDKL